MYILDAILFRLNGLYLCVYKFLICDNYGSVIITGVKKKKIGQITLITFRNVFLTSSHNLTQVFVKLSIFGGKFSNNWFWYL
jgi:hypothetical protein